LIVALAAFGFGMGSTRGAEPASAPAHAVFTKVRDAKWEKIMPDLGEMSPEIAILRVDPETQATQLLIRTPKGIHVRKHWHSANETHTMIAGRAVFECDGKRAELGSGDFNYIPAKMVHEAWLPAGSLTFITVDSAWDLNWVEGPPTAADISK
jgi:mannose-6-phosphate isomerase-like protein (cupin superfamily)